MPEMPGVRLFDPRPIALRARDYTHLALAGLVRTLCDPEAPYPAVVNAAREILDRGYGRAVEMKRTLNMGAFDGYSDADLDELIVRLQSLENPASVIDATASQPPSAPQASDLVELMGLKPAAHHGLLIHALQGTAEGTIDRFAAWLSQINLRLDIVLAVVSGARRRQPPRAHAERPSRQARDRARRPASAGDYSSAATLTPPALRFTRRRRLRRKGG